MKPDIVKGYEGWYEGKYKRADNLEKRVLSVMIEQFDTPKTIIEIGSGTSHFTRWLNSLGFDATGADLSPFMVRQAKTLWPTGDLINARSSNLPFGSNSFDLAMFVTCFEYMPDSGWSPERSARVARQGIVIGLMNAWSLPTLRRKFQMAFGKNDYYLQRAFLLDQRNERTGQEGLRRQSNSGKVENYIVSRAAQLGT